LGVTVDPGVVVAEVLPGTPAAAAGLAPGDLILAVGERAVFTGPELRDAVDAVADEATLRIRRAKAFRELVARLGPPTDAPGLTSGNRLGVTVDPGVVVAEVLPGTPAAAAGLAPGDLVLAVDDQPVLSGDELLEAVLNLPPGAAVILRFGRGAAVREATVQLDRPRLAGDHDG
jgi:S1-C subfamily serine protease